MEPKDKFGRHLYGKVWLQLCENGVKLKQAGYWESKKKPNLFMKIEGDFSLYADMRGTEEVPIWEDTSPLFYAYPKDRKEADQYQTETIRTIIASEIYKLYSAGLDVRLSFYDQCEPGGQSFDVYYQCVNCDMPFGYVSQEPYCDRCEEQHDAEESARDKRNAVITLNHAEKCVVCGVRILSKNKLVSMKQNLEEVTDIEEGQVHHTHYIPEKTISTCRQCHSKIHRSKDPYYQQFKAEITRKEFQKIVSERAKERKQWRLKCHTFMRHAKEEREKEEREQKRLKDPYHAFVVERRNQKVKAREPKIK
ncbi:MAG: hypothetical protein JRN68_10815 [Nitrososphaerota archaeon]|nr:hypothetical protein [Candidatus Sysuiplasma jiujiangense]MDG6935169.1 hypothetical protein [Nitrososphaerota archaeon]